LHTSAYVRIRQRETWKKRRISPYSSRMHEHKVSIRQNTSAYVRMRQRETWKKRRISPYSSRMR
jgi:hypothetical protein